MIDTTIIGKKEKNKKKIIPIRIKLLHSFQDFA